MPISWMRDLGGLHGPATTVFDFGYLQHLRAADAAIVDAGKVERLVEDVALGLGDVEDLDDAVARVIDHLVAATDKLHLVLRKLHAKPSLKGLGE